MKSLGLAGGLILAATTAAAQPPAPTAEHEAVLALVGDWSGGGPFLGGAVKAS